LHWDYLNDANRLKLFDVYSAMLRLRSQFDVFTSGKESLSVNGELKKIQLSLNNHNIILIGNFGLSLKTITPDFQHTGTWYEFFTGNELSVTDLNANLLLNAGEYRLYSDVKLPAFKTLATKVSGNLINPELRIYPNPAYDNLTIESKERIRTVEIYSMEGKLVHQSIPDTNNFNLQLNEMKSGIYILRIQTVSQLYIEKVVKN
jgi:hypothetical protein